MPNAASLIPALSARSPLSKPENQAAAPEPSIFAGLLDVGSETPPPPPTPPPRDAAPARADDARDTPRHDVDRNDQPAPDATNETRAEQEPDAHTSCKETTENGSAKADASADAAKTEDKKTSETNDDAAAGDTATNAEVAVATAALVEATVAVVTPVTIAQIAQQTDVASTSENGDVAATGVLATTPIPTSASVSVSTEPVFSLTAVVQKAAQSTPATAETKPAAAELEAAASTALPQQSSPLKHAVTHEAEASPHAKEGDAPADATGDDGDVAHAENTEHAELLKSLHPVSESKPRRPEHMADATVDTKTSADVATPVPVVNSATSPQTAIQAGLAQATTAVNGAHAADPRSASDPAADAAVPVAGLAVEIVTRAREGKNRFEIRLDPPELGRIDVRLDIDRQGNVTSRLLVERSETLDLLRRDFSNLERALNDAGLKTDSGSLQFAMRDQGFSGGGQQQNESTRSARVIVPGEIETTASVARYNIAQRSGVDIRV